MQRANEIIPAEDVAAAVATAWGGSATASLIRRGFNDTYAVDLNGTRVVARVYLAGKYYLRGEGDIHFELELLRHLAQSGVSVSTPVPRSDGALLGWILDAAGVSRPLALFTWAEGDPIAGRCDSRLVAHDYGYLIASIHAASATFTSTHSRYRLDTAYLVDQPERLLRGCLPAHDEARFAPYREMFEDMRAFLAAQPAQAPGFGLVHGDPHGRNVHLAPDGRITAFDFDHCGYGWRAYDVLTAGAGVPPELQGDFLAGYRSVHPMPEDVAALRRWLPLRVLWDQGDMLAMAPVMGSDYAPSAEQCLEVLDQVSQQWTRAGIP